MDEDSNVTPDRGDDAPTTPDATDETTGTTHERAAASEAPADETGATRVLGAEADGPTRVMPPGEEPTRVMPPPTAAPGAPPLRQPTVTVTKASSSDRTLWVIILVLVILAAAAVALFLLMRPAGSDAGRDYVGTWMPVAASGGGLVIKQNGDRFTVDAYDEQIQQAASAEASLADDGLRFAMPAAALGLADAGQADVTLTYQPAQDTMDMVAIVNGSRAERVYVRTDVLQPAPAPPAPPPTPEPSPTPTPTTSGSPSADADQTIIAGLTAIQAGVVAWAGNSNGVYPAASEVTSTGGIAQYVAPWPLNPYTDQPMAPGTEPGDYNYEQLDGGAGYRLAANLGNNLTYTLP